MLTPKKSARVTLVLIYAGMLLLLAAVIFLPTLVTWYVETMGRSKSLATTVMLTCYPCAPLAAIALFSLKEVTKSILAGSTFCEKNVSRMRRVSWCCLIAAAVMIFAGFFYMPFFIAGAAAAFCGVVARVFTAVINGAAEGTKAESEETV